MAGFHRGFGQRAPGGVDGRAADQSVFRGEIVAEFVGHSVQHLEGLAHNFRTYAVSRHDADMFLHDATFFPEASFLKGSLSGRHPFPFFIRWVVLKFLG